MNQYHSMTLIPPLVKRAKNLAGQMMFTGGCSNGTGRLLRLFASQYQSGMIGEIGAGCGEGSAWIISAMAPGTSFVTVESSNQFAAVVRALFEDYPFVKVLHASWHDIVKFGPFNMVYISFNQAMDTAPEVLLQSLRLGGTVVIDGLMPNEELLAEETISELHLVRDPLRSFWLDDPRLLATEILVSSDEAVILATRIE